MKVQLVGFLMVVCGVACIESPPDSSGPGDAAGFIDAGSEDTSTAEFCENCRLQLVEEEGRAQLENVSCGRGEDNLIGTQLFASALDVMVGEVGIHCDGFELSPVEDGTFNLVQSAASRELSRGTSGDRSYSRCETGVLIGADIRRENGFSALSAICAEPSLQVSESEDGELTTELILGEITESQPVPRACDPATCDSVRTTCSNGKVMNGLAVVGPADEAGSLTSINRIEILCIRPTVVD